MADRDRRRRRARIVLLLPNRLFRKLPGPARGVGILRPAIVLRERGQDRAALIFAIGAAEPAAAQPLEAARDLIEIGPHLLDLVVDRTALRRLAGEQREEPGTVAAHALGLLGDAIELGLLLGGGILVAADLVVLGGIAAAAAVDGRQLRFQPRAHRIDRRALRRGGGAPDSSAPGLCAKAPELSASRRASAAQARNSESSAEGNGQIFAISGQFEQFRPLGPCATADAANAAST